MIRNITSWTVRIMAAVILLQTLFFKFTGAAESVEIFTQLGLEPQGRMLIGVLELIVAILLLIPQSAACGGLLGVGIMSGAILSHITKLGWQGEMLSLGLLAVLVWVLCLITVALHRKQITIVSRMLDSRDN